MEWREVRAPKGIRQWLLSRQRGGRRNEDGGNIRKEGSEIHLFEEVGGELSLLDHRFL
jgi:hypothetical protein